MRKPMFYVVLAAIALFNQAAFSYSFSQSYFVRRQAELAKLIIQPQKFTKGEQFTYRDWEGGWEFRIVTILDADEKTVHYKEKQLAYDIKNKEGWIDVASGQLIKIVIDDKDLETDAFDPLDMKIINAQVDTKSPIGNLKGISIGFSATDRLGGNEDIVISESAPGTGLIYRHKLSIAGDRDSRWAEYFK